jgi:hypothetical protein
LYSRTSAVIPIPPTLIRTIFSATNNQDKTQHRLTMKSTSRSEGGPTANDPETVCKYFVGMTDPYNCICPNYDSHGCGKNCPDQGWWDWNYCGCPGIQPKCAAAKAMAAT